VPGGIVLYTQEELTMTASDGSRVEVVADGTIHSTCDQFAFTLQLDVQLNGENFFTAHWDEHITRDLL
jgi:hypothetical protein